MTTLLVALLVLAQVEAKPAVVAPKSALTLVSTVELPKVDGRIDHMAFVPSTRKLFVAALEHGSVLRLDLKTGSVMGEFEDPGEPQGLLYLVRSDVVVATDGKLPALWIFPVASQIQWATEEKTKTRSLHFHANRVEMRPDSDNIRELAGGIIVVIAFGDGGLAFAVPEDNFNVQWVIELGGHPESFQINAAETRAWANVPSKQVIAVVDLQARKVLRSIELKSAKQNYPMALAESDKRLLIGCREPARLLVFDIDTDQQVAELPLSGDVDDIFVDDARGLVYASCGEGFVDVFERTGPGAWKPNEKVATSVGARTCLFVASERRLFVAVPHRGDQKAEIRVFSTAP